MPPLGALIIATLGWELRLLHLRAAGLGLRRALVCPRGRRAGPEPFVSPAEAAHIGSGLAATPSGRAASATPALSPKPRFDRLDRVIRGRSIRPIATARPGRRSPPQYLGARHRLPDDDRHHQRHPGLAATYLTNVKHFSLMNSGSSPRPVRRRRARQHHGRRVLRPDRREAAQADHPDQHRLDRVHDVCADPRAERAGDPRDPASSSPASC